MNQLMKVVVVLLFSCAAGPATKPVEHLKDDAPDIVQQIWYGKKKARLDELRAELGAEMASVKEIQQRKAETAADRAAKVEDAKAEQGKIDAIKDEQVLVTKANGKVKLPETLLVMKSDLAQGWIGTITTAKGKGGPLASTVAQVVDANNVIVTCKSKAVDQNPFGDYVHFADVDVWISNIDTTGMTDGANFVDGFKIVITGTKQFDTEGGSTRTVLSAVPFDINDFIEK